MTTSFKAITSKFADEVNAVVNEGADLADFDELYDELFTFFCDSGEMPYGVAKARTGDPYEWITNYLDNTYGG